MSYTPPAGDNAGFSWVGETADYTAPAGDAAGFSWTPERYEGRIAAPSPLGAPQALGSIPVTVVGGRVAVSSPLGAPSVLGEHVIAGRASAPSPLGVPDVRGEVAVVGRAAAPSPLAAPAVLGQVVRYELRGEVRKDGVLVDRLVRGHRLDTGAVVGEGQTDGGRFRLHVGFEPLECYTLALDMSAGATDYTPPVANHVTAELADDTA